MELWKEVGTYLPDFGNSLLQYTSYSFGAVSSKGHLIQTPFEVLYFLYIVDTTNL